jgi:hypothetical protein
MRPRHSPVPALPPPALVPSNTVAMKSSAVRFGLGTEFDAFLFAPIGEDSNGLPLRIVSLLGRLNLDPWTEASALALLPAGAATQKLASLLAAVPVSSLDPPDLTAVATHLATLLRHRTHLVARPPGTASTDSAAPPRLTTRALLLAMWLIGLLGLQALMSRSDAPPHAAGAPVAVAQATPAQAPPIPAR